MGSVYLLQAEYTTALNHYHRALIIAREVGNQGHEAILLSNINLVYKELGKPQDSLKNYQQVLAISKDESRASTLNNMRNVYVEIGQYEKTLDRTILKSTRILSRSDDNC
jgi:tetratricopeptide (TPR) repeat protein